VVGGEVLFSEALTLFKLKSIRIKIEVSALDFHGVNWHLSATLMMVLIMKHQLGFCEEEFTKGTLQIALIPMDSHMFVKIALLGEGLGASENWAHKRFLLGVASQMIKEIVPFLKASLTAMELTQEYLGPTFTLRLKVFNILEGS